MPVFNLMKVSSQKQLCAGDLFFGGLGLLEFGRQKLSGVGQVVHGQCDHVETSLSFGKIFVEASGLGRCPINARLVDAESWHKDVSSAVKVVDV